MTTRDRHSGCDDLADLVAEYGDDLPRPLRFKTPKVLRYERAVRASRQAAEIRRLQAEHAIRTRKYGAEEQ